MRDLDYGADAWGFTYGSAAEWYEGDWILRGITRAPLTCATTPVAPA
jgi:high affinity Mn2+ porin